VAEQERDLDTGGDPHQWIADARAGSSSALGRLFESCRPYLLAIANSELGADLQSKVGASDLVQQTFLNAQKEFVGFRGQSEAELLAWLRRILRNSLVDASRHYGEASKREVGREQPLSGSAVFVAAATPPPSPRSLAALREDAARLEQALRQLPEHYRRAIQLRHQEGKTFAEVAAALGCSEEAARKTWSRAVDQLRQILEPACD
jgi:RNA polymerase sigma-70 factor (ECF subfamily)